MIQEIHWKDAPAEHHYDGASEFLSLMFDDIEVPGLIGLLREAEIRTFAAKDIFRASGVQPLSQHNVHVRRNTEKIEKNAKLSPLLLVKVTTLHRLIVADGYHRLNAVYLWNEDIITPCKLASVP